MAVRAVVFGIVALMGPAALGEAWAQATPPSLSDDAAAPPRAGEKLKTAKGDTVGKIEKTIADAAGQPRQVLVRVAGVLRVLPLDALTRRGGAYVTVLSRAELEALPQAEQP